MLKVRRVRLPVSGEFFGLFNADIRKRAIVTPLVDLFVVGSRPPMPQQREVQRVLYRFHSASLCLIKRSSNASRNRLASVRLRAAESLESFSKLALE